jgi:hypothetical protein
VLVKRRKKACSSPARQILCWRCGSPVEFDDGSGSPHPQYSCVDCGAHWPPTDSESAEVVARLRRGSEIDSVRRKAATRYIEKQRAAGLPSFGVTKLESGRASRHRKKEQDAQVIDAILEKRFSITDDLEQNVDALNAILDGGKAGSQRRGRKSEAAYEKALYFVEMARVAGREITLSELVEKVLPYDRSSEDSKIEKLKKALKRRNKSSNYLQM